jgi:hypothetical protein
MAAIALRCSYALNRSGLSTTDFLDKVDENLKKAMA